MFSQEITTCDPKFYKHTQRIFLLLHEHGLAYQAESTVNWDPVDKTVLANEQVDVNGCSWRSGAKVEKRLLKQWFLKISEFRDALLDDLEVLSCDGLWPDRVLAMQKNWLGRSKGARIKFQVMAFDKGEYQPVEVFTTRPDTLYGVQYVALAATHPIVLEAAKNDAGLQAFMDGMPDLPQDSKVGYLLPNVRAINPLAFEEKTPEETKASLPIYVAPYVLGDYGDGAVMGVPGHDTRDFAFWNTNRANEQVRMVVSPAGKEPMTEEAFVHHGVLSSNCGVFAGQPSSEAAENIVNLLKSGEQGDFAETWRLRDWLISRQRYWGTPIPMIHCDSCGVVPVPVEDLPVELPKVEGNWLQGKGGNPLEDAPEWSKTSCPNCGGAAKRDTDTMDTFVDSSWYFMRFPDAHNDLAPFSPDIAKEFLPVDLYIGGVEHAILHLLYARFISKFLATTELWPAGASESIRGEPFKRLVTQGMVHGKTYSDPSNGRFLKPEEVDLSMPSKPKVISTGETALTSSEKMSKSKYNGVDPGTCFEKYGADATRAHILFQAPISEVLVWDEEKISGVTRWLRRVLDLVESHKDAYDIGLVVRDDLLSHYTSVSSLNQKELKEWDQMVDLWLAVQRTIVSVTDSLEKTYSLNTVVSDLMSLANVIAENTSKPALKAHAIYSLVRMMAPITPAVAEECFEIMGGGDSIFKMKFPKADGTLEILKKRMMTTAVQVNGKLKFALEIEKASDGVEQDELREWIVGRVTGSQEWAKRVGQSVEKARKVIVVRGGKTINFVF